MERALQICHRGIAHARERNMKPVAIAVLDIRAAVRSVLVEDGCSIRRAEIAIAKANAVLATGESTRSLSTKPPHFLAGIAHVVGGMVPTAGGLIILDDQGNMLGAIGVSGEASDIDEQIAMAGTRI
ncbi:heme-binding protein [Ensifer adhaerens]|nr:heme-binding protein [Ensifer adhaerens]WDZ78988.1 heme-binding protein [Ensifer adhaerens]